MVSKYGSWPRNFFDFDWLALLLIMAASLALLLFRLDYPVLWSDEIFTANYIRNEYGFLLDFDRPDERHPPGHYVGLKFWTDLFGLDRIGLRTYSVVWALICLPLIYGIARIRLGHRTALVAALFLALFPGFFHYAREARMYAQIFGLLMLASFLFILLFTRFEGLSTFKRALITVGFAVALAGTFFSHYMSGVFFVCFSVATVVLAVYRGRYAWMAYAIAGLALATLLIIPQFLHMLAFVSPADDEWIPFTDLGVFYATMSGAFDAPTILKPLLYLSYIAGFVLLWRRDRDLFVFLAVFLVLGPVLLALIGTVRPMLLVRTVQPFTLFAPILIAVLVTQVPWRGIGLSLGACLAAINVATLAQDIPAQRLNLFSETAEPILSAIQTPPDAVFYMSHLDAQLELVGVDRTNFVPITFGGFDAEAALIQTHFDNCSTSNSCGRTIIILELNPRFEVEAGETWLSFARSLDPTEEMTMEGHVIYVYQ